MSTERRRSAEGGRRRADGPDDGPRGDGGRRRAAGPPREERAGGRRRPDSEDGLRGDDQSAPRSRRTRPPGDEARSEGRPRPEGGRRRAEGERPRRPEEQRRRRPEDEDRPRRRPDGQRPRRPEEGERPRRRPDDPRAGGRRRAEGPRDPRDREHGSRSEGRRSGGRGSRAAAGSGGRGGGGGRRRPREDEPDDRPWYKRFLSKAWKPALAFFGLMIIGGVAAFAVLYAMAPDVEQLAKNAESEASATQIQWAAEGDEENGEVALTTGEVKRVVIQREDIPEEVVDGVLAAEQATFYEDPGINLKGIGRAVLSRGEAGGGSTITQQMARNYYSELDGDPPLTRKIREIFIAIKLSQQVPHDEILTTYLNTIYFGRGASGIEMAAQAYFGKSVSELDRAEGAYLGIIIQMPSNFESPAEGSWTDNYLNKERWPYVQRQLAAMHENTGGERGLPEAEASALDIPDTIIPYEPEVDDDDPKLNYVRQAVLEEVTERYDISGGSLATDGYVVKTSLDPELMDAAAEAFSVLPSGEADDTMKGLTAVDPSTGEIVAFNGGPNMVEVENNSLVHQTQAGSAYKPYVLARALMDGIGLRTVLDGDTGREFPGLASPVNNSGNADYGEVDLIESTMNSINTSYVDLGIRVGINEGLVDDLAVQMGVDPARQETSTVGPLVALGTHQVNALDMASGYATFAAEGRHFPAHMVTEVLNSEGEVRKPKDADQLESGEEVLPSGVAADATHAMKMTVQEGGASNAALSDGREVAGKTGTSSDAVSAWFVGYTPQMSVAVGLSRRSGEPLQFDVGTDDIYGGTTSAKVWKAFMETAMEGVEPQAFPAPQWVGEDQSFVPTPSPSETPEDVEPSDEPSDEPSEPDCDPNDPECELEPPLDEECDIWDRDCQDEESPEPPGECDTWPQPDHCDDDGGGGFPGVPGPPENGDQNNQGNNSLIRPRGLIGG